VGETWLGSIIANDVSPRAAVVQIVADRIQPGQGPQLGEGRATDFAVFPFAGGDGVAQLSLGRGGAGRDVLVVAPE
jgi:hypothetical protein